MSKPSIAAICAFDIARDGTTEPASEICATAGFGPNVAYRWLHFDLNNPELKDWASANLPEAAASALTQSETRPRCDSLEEGLILNLRGVNLNPGSNPEDMVSLRMWISKSVIVSARSRKVWAADAIRQAAAAGTAPRSIGAFLVDLTRGLSKRIESVSLELDEQTDGLEELSLSGHESFLTEVSALRQSVIKMRRFVNPQREALDALAKWDNPLIEPQNQVLLREVSNRTKRSVEELDATRERLATIQDHLDANRTNSLSRNSYLLSVVAAIFLPLGFLTGLFGVNVAGMPGLEAEMAFWILTVVSILAGGVLYLVFKFSKWL